MPPVWALLVSITEYFANTTLGPVSGANADAGNVIGYLKDDLHVPDDHIKWLSDSAATREEIISAFKRHLISNSNIAQGDAILFYFSGHGAFLKAPEGWLVDEENTGDPDQDGTVEVILPWDQGKTYPDAEYATCGIPDRTLAALINEAASLHGNNITIVLDCCCSGHGCRAEDVATERVVLNGEELLPRSADASHLAPLNPTTDHDILSGPHSPHAFVTNVPLPSTSVPCADDVDATTESAEDIDAGLAPFNHKFDDHVFAQVHARANELAKDKRLGRFRALASSHVLIAACKSRERALGGLSGGILTRMWILLMKSNTLCPRTYAELVKCINDLLAGLEPDQSTIDQHPQCEGIVRDRLIFEETMIKEDHFRARRIYGEGKEGCFEVEAGEIHGVTNGTEVEVWYLDEDLHGIKLGTAKVQSVHATTSLAHSHSALRWVIPEGPLTYTATIVQSPKLSYATRGDSTSVKPTELETLYKSLAENSCTYKVEDEGAADIQLCFNPDGTIDLRRLGPVFFPLPNPTPKLTEPDLLELSNVNKIFSGIARFNWLLPLTNVTHPFAKDIAFEMYELDRQSFSFLQKIENPMVPASNGDIEVKEDEEYAIVIRNKTPRNLYAQVWYFDADTYGIECLYESPNNAEVTLAANGGILQLGASREVIWPLTYFLPERNSRSTLFCKVFLTEKPTKLSSLSQPALIGKDADRGRDIGRGNPATGGLWDTIVQRITVY